jgi:hypothetical protein
MRALRLVTAATFGLALVPLGAGAANAAPPDNDESSGAVVLHLGDRIEEDTTEATTTPDDAALNDSCGAPATNASVWFTYTPGTQRNVVVDVTESDFSAGLMIFKGTPTPDSLLSCAPGILGLHARAGQTYYVMAFSDTDVNGGNLVLSLKNAPPPNVHVAVARRGLAFHGGSARLHGTYSCKNAPGFAEVDAHLKQRAGRLKIQATSGAPAVCDGRRRHWSARLVSPFGTYAQGRAVARVTIIGCGLLQCRQATTMRRVHLVWASSSQHQGMVHPSGAPAGRPHPILSRYTHWPTR